MLAVAMVGLSFVALTITSVSGIEAEYSGVAGSLINMTQSVGGAIGLAITAVGLPRRSESVLVAKISTTTSIAAAVPARSHHDH